MVGEARGAGFLRFSNYRRLLQKTLWEAGARRRAAAAGALLAPGELSLAADDARHDQRFLLERARRLGPVFKVWMPHKLTTCIVGHGLARRFLAENAGGLRAATPDLSPLFPHGFLRAMEGTPHGFYRRRMAEAFRATAIAPANPRARAAVRACLADCAEAPQPVVAAALRRRIRALTMDLMLWFVLGVDPGCDLARRLAADCAAYAPEGAFLVVRRRHRRAYRVIRDRVAAHARTLETHPSPPGLLGHFVRAGTLDETVLGNLVQMVVVASYDLGGLFLWLLKHVADDPATADLARGPGDERADAVRPALAIVRETLRMEQSELLLRVATRDIVFDGFFIPRHSHVRICVWEAHHDPALFDRPFEHDCRRFMEATVAAGDYAPFGMDRHRCLGADWTQILGQILVEELACGYRLAVADDGPPEFGRFHFQPSGRLAVAFERISHDAR